MSGDQKNENDSSLDEAFDAWEEEFHAPAASQTEGEAGAAPKPEATPAEEAVDPDLLASAPAPWSREARGGEPRGGEPRGGEAGRGRPLYRPPTSDELARPVPRSSAPLPLTDFFDDDGEDEMTRVGVIPADLMASLRAPREPVGRGGAPARAAKADGEGDRETIEPPPPVGLDLDLDELFDGDYGASEAHEALTLGSDTPTAEPTHEQEAETAPPPPISLGDDAFAPFEDLLPQAERDALEAARQITRGEAEAIGEPPVPEPEFEPEPEAPEPEPEARLAAPLEPRPSGPDAPLGDSSEAGEAARGGRAPRPPAGAPRGATPDRALTPPPPPPAFAPPPEAASDRPTREAPIPSEAALRGSFEAERGGAAEAPGKRRVPAALRRKSGISAPEAPPSASTTPAAEAPRLPLPAPPGLDAVRAAPPPLAPPPARPPALPEADAAAPSAVAPPAAQDQGAATARRTVRYRKPRREHFPLVGSGPDALRARKALILDLAHASSTRPKARAKLLVSAAEIAEQLGEPAEASEHLVAARAADPSDLMALRGLRRHRMIQRDWREFAALCQAEAALPLSAEERALALTLLTEVQAHVLRDPKSAERAAKSSLVASQDSVLGGMLLAEACAMQGRSAEQSMALERAARGWHDGARRAPLLIEVARIAERAGQLRRAAPLYDEAAQADPEASDAILGQARTHRALGEVQGAIEALGRLAALVQEPRLRTAFVRSAALISLRLEQDAAGALAALKTLGESRDLMCLETQAEAAEACEPSALESIYRAWAEAAGGTERALALVALAETLASRGDLEGADQALRDAALADGELGTVRVVRELIARRAGDASRLSTAVAGRNESSSLQAAAKLVADPEGTSQELQLLEAARQADEAPLVADVLALDAAAASGAEEATTEGLRREMKRSAPERRLGGLLCLAERLRTLGALAEAREVLEEARALAPGEPLALRALAELAEGPVQSAALWLEEASGAGGPRAAYAAVRAGRILRAAGRDEAQALRRALDALPGYPPAAWALEPIARERGEIVTRIEIQEGLANAIRDPHEIAGRLCRAALLRSQQGERAAAVALLERARGARGEDALLLDLLLRMGGDLPAARRAEILEASARGMGPPWARIARLRAAGSHEDDGQHSAAAQLYRGALEQDGGDAVATAALDRAELAAGEYGRVAQRHLEAIRRAEGTEARVSALSALADIDLYERRDADAAAESLRSILELAPGHLPSLRAIERYAMDRGDDGALVQIEERLATHLGAVEDSAAHARLASRLLLQPEEAEGNAADGILRAAIEGDRLDLWLARRAEGAAMQASDAEGICKTRLRIAEALAHPDERASVISQAKSALRGARGARATAEALRLAAEQAPEHPTVWEALGHALSDAGEPEAAAEALEHAARNAKAPRHAALLWYEAGRIRQDELGDPSGALVALGHAGEADLTFLDVFDRLRRIHSEQQDTEALDALIRKRLALGGDGEALLELHMAHADLCRQRGEAAGVKQALRAALALRPEHVEALRALAECCLSTDDWQSAAEALIRFARLRRDRDELRWVFLTLGEIYDTNMPDPLRAEAALRRVLKLIPDDTEALSRLADLLRRNEQHAQAAEAARDLIRASRDALERRANGLLLAEILEEGGDTRESEKVLEEMRRLEPTEIGIVTRLAEFYRRQDAPSALSMHFNRALGDFRLAVEERPGDGRLWPGFVDVLVAKGLPDAARSVASAGAAIGIADIEMSRRLDVRGGIPGARKAAADRALDELLAPSPLAPATRRVLELAHDALAKILPFDAKAWHAEKLGSKHSARLEAKAIGEWFGFSDVHVLLTPNAPRVCVPVADSPPTIVLGKELFETTDRHQRAFLFARALKIASSWLSVAIRSQPAALSACLVALVRSYREDFPGDSVPAAELEEMMHR
ncbi:MAG: hypothetical protein OEY14_00220, partial [Myxococcales bacterium]|nr:hypothetical protein [Myxococcales bacterium]